MTSQPFLSNATLWLFLHASVEKIQDAPALKATVAEWATLMRSFFYVE